MSQKKITDNQIRLTGQACGLSHRLTGYLGIYCRLVAGSVAAVPRLAKIAEAFRVCERQARRIMNDLASSGAIAIARRYMIVCGKAKQLSNRYTVMVSPVAAALQRGRVIAKAIWRASCRVVAVDDCRAKADIFGRLIPNQEDTRKENGQPSVGRLFEEQPELEGLREGVGLRGLEGFYKRQEGRKKMMPVKNNV